MVSTEPAASGDAPALLALREAASSWLASRGIHQWVSGEVTLHEIRDQVVAGEWFVVRGDLDGAPRVAAALRLLWDDEAIWGPQPPVSAYVHGLVVGRRGAGSGLGVALLGWAADQARCAGRSLLRLDCGKDNAALRAYYQRQGFAQVGRRDVQERGYSLVLLEKDVRAH